MKLLAFIMIIYLTLGCMTDTDQYVTSKINTDSQSLSYLDRAIRILPLGDSRVEGSRPNYESYRYELWKLFMENEWHVDFVGPLVDESNYPSFMNTPFDTDHAGVGGFTSEDILLNISEALSAIESPDIVLLGIGGNDLLANTEVDTVIEQITEVIDILHNHNPHVTIFLEQIAPGNQQLMTAEFEVLLNTFHRALKDLASSHHASIVLVDMYTDWQENYLADEVHYNELGAQMIAERYYQALSDHFDPMTTEEDCL